MANSVKSMQKAVSDWDIKVMIQAIRHTAQLSQPKFAEKLGISVATLRSWEQGLRKPSGAAKTLLDLLHRRPDLIDELRA